MAIENTYLLGKNITLGCGFDLQAKAPLDSRQTVPAFAGLQALIDNNAAYEGMIVYDEETKKTYQAQIVDDVLKFREFGINEAELKDLIASETTAAMEFKGAATALPENPAKGDMYKVTAAFKIGEEDVKVGDSIVYDGAQWFIIPSGDDIEDTWRPVTGVDNDATLTFVAGDKLEKTVAADGTITYKHVAIDTPTNMNEEGDEPTRTYITQLITDNHGHVIGFKTATEVVEDTDTTYEFEGQSDEATSVYFQVKSSDAEAAEVIYLDAYSKNEANLELAKKVDKVDGFSLVSDTEIARLAEVDNYDDEEVRGLIGDNADAIDELVEYVGTIPNVPDADGNNKYADLDVIGYINKKAQETLAAAQGGSSETAASVKGQLDDYIGENNTRVKAIEDDVAAIKDAETGILKQAQDYADGLAGNYDEAGAAAGVKSELEGEIAKKVTAVEGKDLIATSEIERLATLANYDDTQVKADIAKKADAETMTTELGKKVDKVDGKDLIATSEIERLATLHNYDDTALAGRVTTAEGKITALETESDKHALKTDVEAEFAKYTKTDDLPTDLGDFTNNAGYAKTADVNVELDKKADKTQVAADIETAIAPLATTEALNGVKATADAAAVKTEVDAAMLLKADKSVVDAMYTNTQIDGFIATEKGRAEGIEAGLRTDVDVIKADYLKAADKTSLETLISTAQTTANNAAERAEVACSGVDSLDMAIELQGETITAQGERITTIEGKIQDLSGALRFRGVLGYVPEHQEDNERWQPGDVIIVGNKEYVCIGFDFVEFGDAEPNAKAITELTTRVTTAEGDIDTLEANLSALEEQCDDHNDRVASIETVLDYFIIDGIDVDEHIRTLVDDAKQDLSGQIETVEVSLTESINSAEERSAADATSKANTAEANAKEHATGLNTAMNTRVEALEAINHEAYIAADTALKTELQAEIDADVNVVNNSLEAYKTSNNAEVEKKANSADVYAKTETFNKDEVNAAIAAAVTAALTWGEF